MDIGKLKIPAGGKFKLKKRDPSDHAGISKADAEKARPQHAKKMASLQELLYAEHKHAILIVLQGMDAAGKDGTIKHVM
jgi:polyphosphate kinase 2 (PPK2 family)